MIDQRRTGSLRSTAGTRTPDREAAGRANHGSERHPERSNGEAAGGQHRPIQVYDGGRWNPDAAL
jgi:hypothetical protein